MLCQDCRPGSNRGRLNKFVNNSMSCLPEEENMGKTHWAVLQGAVQPVEGSATPPAVRGSCRTLLPAEPPASDRAIYYQPPTAKGSSTYLLVLHILCSTQTR